MEAAFYLSATEVQPAKFGKDRQTFDHPGAGTPVVMFKMTTPATGNPGAIDFEYEGKASADNVKGYPIEFANFLAANPTVGFDVNGYPVVGLVQLEDKKAKKKLVEAEVAKENKDASEVDL